MKTLRNLKRIRELKGWSGSDLARASGVHKNTISKLQRLERKAHGSTVKLLARALDVPADKLTGRPLPGTKQIACPYFVGFCLDGADYRDTAKAYEMGECVVMVRSNRSGWVMTLFHPDRPLKREELEDAWDSLVGPWIPSAAGLNGLPRRWPAEAPKLPGRWGATGKEPYRWTVVQPTPIPRNEYEASEEEKVDGDTEFLIDDTGLHMSSSSNIGNAFDVLRNTDPYPPPSVYEHTWEHERVPYFVAEWVQEKYPGHAFVWDEHVYTGDNLWQSLRLTLG